MIKKKIAILGSTGSIGKSTLNIIRNKKKYINIFLLTTHRNYKKILEQSKEFNVKNILIFDKVTFKKTQNLFKKNHIKTFNNLDDYLKLNKTKFDFVMSAISGLDGLKPTLSIIKNTKKIAIANKESIICGWNLIKKKLDKYKTLFIPVDSEHFSIWSLLNNSNSNKIDSIIITASGGPFLHWQIKKIKKASLNKALKHPNWSMGKKISIDSATLMNKVFEVIEAQRIFNIPQKKIKILIHENSYVHAIVKFNNGITKLLVHDTNMEIPIFNCLFDNSNFIMKSKPLNIDLLNKLDFKEVDYKKFPSVKNLLKISDKISLFDTILVSANETLVNLYLKNKIEFGEINYYLNKLLNKKEFAIYKKKAPKNLNEIKQLDDYVRLKTLKLCI